MAFEVRYSSEALNKLNTMRAFDRAAILDGIEETLRVNPTLESQAKIKKLRQPAPTQFRFRVGDYRVSYDVEGQAVNVVTILSKEDTISYLEGGHDG